MVTYNVRNGIKKIRTKLFVSVATLGLLLGGGGISLAMFGTAHAISPVWNVTGSYQINVEYQSVNYPETLDLTQSGTAITGGDLNTNPPAAASAFTVTGGSVSGNSIDISATQVASTLAVHFAGTIAPAGSMSGSWNDVTPGARVGTWATTSGAATMFSDRNFDIAKDKNLSPDQCSLTRQSRKVVDVSFKLVNDFDSAVGGNAWANDTINRNLDIWNTSGNNYCAIVSDNGSIVTFNGPSPNGTGNVDAGIKGNMDGGYRTVAFTGAFAGNALYKTHGNLGTFDLACSPSTAPGYTCDGTHPNFGNYFSDVDANSVGLAWWGWEYNTCQNGSWINSIDANFGDITGNAPTGRDKDKCQGDNDSHHHDHDGFRWNQSFFNRFGEKHFGPRG